MKILDKDQIIQLIKNVSHDELLGCIEDAFTAYSNGTSNIPPVGHLGIKTPPGDVHIKYGHIAGDEQYVIKIASGFYENPNIGLPSSNGMMLAFDAKTGALKSLLHDEGYLTDLRTALAGAVSAKYLAPKDVTCIGIVGTGTQARFQLEMLKSLIGCKKVIVSGRSEAKLNAYKTDMEQYGYEVETTVDVEYLCSKSNLIITTTPSEQPLIKSHWIRKGTHITAMGADTIGKQELDPELFVTADIIACDSLSQCMHHGEIQTAINNQLIEEKDLIEMGTYILNPVTRTAEMITIADLTGIATQDIKITLKTLENA